MKSSSTTKRSHFRSNHPNPTRIGKKNFVWGDRTFLMGIINTTPDSFSGDGIDYDIEKAIKLAKKLEQHGAHILDVGGESTRPTSIYSDVKKISIEEELARTIPVIQALNQIINIPISIDTTKSLVAKTAIENGASLVNDISGLSFDKNMANVVKEAKVPVVLMNNQSTQGRTNRAKENFKSLQRLMDTAIECGIDSDKIILDPGIGFSKSVEENLEIINSLEIFQQLQHPILLGPSRKNTIQAILGPSNPKNRFEGTAALSVIAITKGVDILRVHDIEQLNKVSRMADAVIREPLANNAF